MADIRKQKFYTVETSAAKANAGELERKIRIHRKKIAASIAAAAITITVLPEISCVITTTGHFTWTHLTIRFGIRHLKCRSLW